MKVDSRMNEKLETSVTFLFLNFLPKLDCNYTATRKEELFHAIAEL